MLAGIIKEKKKTYNIYLEQKDDKQLISITEETKGCIRALDEAEIYNLVAHLLSSKLTFKEKQNEYDIYIDEAGNKRFYKNGKEDYPKSFYSNGKSALSYLINEEIENRLKKIRPFHAVKKFQLVIGKTAVMLIISSGLLSIYNPITNRTLEPNAYYLVQDITLDEALDLINKTPHLTDDEKQLLSNENLLRFVIESSKDRNDNSLRKGLTNDKIKRFKGDPEKGPAGYVNPLYPNIMFINEDIETGSDIYYIILDHEFGHILQGKTKYYYIKEALTDIIKDEFRETDNDTNHNPIEYFLKTKYGLKETSGYYQEVKNLKILLEIIGPQPIIESNYNENDEPFENTIKKYLEPAKAQALLKLFETTGDELLDMTPEEEDQLNEKIFALLSQMYYNKYGEEISNNFLINQIRNDEEPKKLYFNKYRNDYYEPHYVTIEEEQLGYYIDQVDTQGIVRILYYESHECTKEEISEIQKLKNYSGLTSRIETANDIIYDTTGHRATYKGKVYTEEELKELGLVQEKIYYETCQEITNIANASPKKYNHLMIEYNDGRIAKVYADENDDEEKWGFMETIKTTTIKIPPITEQFPEIPHDATKERYDQIIDRGNPKIA